MEKPTKGEEPKTKETLLERIRDKRGDIPASIDPEVIKRELANVAPYENFVTGGALLKALRRVVKES